MAPFRIGINMAGAVSAGAYTAGVLDFLTDALDEWYGAKAAGAAVPQHDVSIEVFSGASAGGMCAAISAVMLQEEFEHIRDPELKRSAQEAPSTNRFYESWVNRIDITKLLGSDDLKKGQTVISLLDSTVIQQIAGYAVTPKAALPGGRPYLSDKLTLFLSLTNLRGVPYSLNSVAPGSVEESTFFYGDRMHFELSRTSTGAAPKGTVRYLNHSLTGAEGGWEVLQTAAMATGAFPLFLAPRPLTRYGSEYCPPHWESVTSAVTGLPNFPAGLQEPFVTLNVDGGVTNNVPFNFAHDYLASLEPDLSDDEGAQEPAKADRAVITIAPFPTTEQMSPRFDAKKSASIFWAFPRLFSALISQSRFFGESLSEIMRGVTFNRFVIAPSDTELTKEHRDRGGSPEDQPPALQCASLGAFGGFFERGFRAHDYQLGRRNCQKFLEESFVLPFGNTIIDGGLNGLDADRRAAVEKNFVRPAPGTYADNNPTDQQQRAGDRWMPIIPLCTDVVKAPIPRITRQKITQERLDLIVTLIVARYRVVVRELIGLIPSCAFRFFLNFGQPAIRRLLHGTIQDALTKQLGDDLES